MRRFPLTVRFLRLKKRLLFAPPAILTAMLFGATGFFSRRAKPKFSRAIC
jgi:hypothetical protein